MSESTGAGKPAQLKFAFESLEGQRTTSQPARAQTLHSQTIRPPGSNLGAEGGWLVGIPCAVFILVLLAWASAASVQTGRQDNAAARGTAPAPMRVIGSG